MGIPAPPSFLSLGRELAVRPDSSPAADLDRDQGVVGEARRRQVGAPPSPDGSDRFRPAIRSGAVAAGARPRYLLDARRAHDAGALEHSDFKRIEDRAVREVIALQEEAGCPVVTDGELRRDSFQSELTAAVDGFEGVSMDAWLWGQWHSDVVGELRVERPPGLGVVAPLRRRRSLAAEELTFLRAHTDRIAKVTLPSPTLFANLWSPERSREAYPTLDDFMTDVVAVLKDEVRELLRLGCTYLQLDAPHYPLLLDRGWRAF